MSAIFPIVAESVEAAIDPNNKLTFLIDWEVTLKCNLDCSYCGDCHDNSKPHPLLSECLETIDFMYKYVDVYMKHKAPWSRRVILNIYGGESLFHPNIVEILEQSRIQHKPYKDRWSLTITTTTNALVSPRQINRIVNLIDEFTVSYHTESTEKQKQQIRDNLLLIKHSNKRLKCVIPMHTAVNNFNEDLDHIEFCKKHQIKYLPKPLDSHSAEKTWEYNTKQIQWFNSHYQKNTFTENKKDILPNNSSGALTRTGRSCCGGRQLVANQNFKERLAYAGNTFTDWYCSVNWFFLFIKQTTKELYVNKDCKMDFGGQVGPIGYLDNVSEILDNLEISLDKHTLPTIQCKKNLCFCGLCAPKAKHETDYKQLMKKYLL